MARAQTGRKNRAISENDTLSPSGVLVILVYVPFGRAFYRGDKKDRRIRNHRHSMLRWVVISCVIFSVLLLGCGTSSVRQRPGVNTSSSPEIAATVQPRCKSIQYDGPSEGPVCYALQEKLVEGAKNGDLAAINEALAKGAHIEAGYAGSYPALESACLTGKSEAVSLLIDKGADLNRVGTFGATPLFVATYYGHKNVVQILIEKGADVCLDHVDDGRRIVRLLGVAREREFVEIEQMLVEANAESCSIRPIW